MKCEHCGNTEAVVKITRIDPDGNVVPYFLCQECAADMSPYQKAFLAKQKTFQTLLSELIASAEGAETEEESTEGISSATCPSCGLDFSQYRTSSMLGCPDCYDAFGPELEADLRRYHRATSHAAGAPGTEEANREMEDTLSELRRELKIAVDEERYQDAARLRDEISRTEQRLAGGEQETKTD